MKDDKGGGQKQIQLNIRCDEETSKGLYSNLAKISHTFDEFSLDFIYVNPDPPFGRLQSRIILSPSHAKRVLEALTQQIEKYERNFGEIKLPPATPDNFGYVQ